MGHHLDKGHLVTTGISGQIVGPTIPTRHDAGPPALAIGLVSAGVLGTIGTAGTAGLTGGFKNGGWKKALIVGGAVALIGGIAAAIVGPKLIGGGDKSGATDGREVGTAYGRKTVRNDDGTQEWARRTAPLTLNKTLGAVEGYATLSAAIAAAHPNQQGTDEMAFIREGAGVKAFSLKTSGLEATEAFRATTPNVVAYTSRESALLYAGPAATPNERSGNNLRDAPPAPF